MNVFLRFGFTSDTLPCQEEMSYWATHEKLLAKATNADFVSLLILIKVANKEVLYFIALRI